MSRWQRTPPPPPLSLLPPLPLPLTLSLTPTQTFRYVPRVILQHLVPVKPRKRESLAPGQKEIHPFADHAAPGASGVTLHFLSKRLLSEPKIVVNTRIVVVGASATAAAFLEQLLFTPYIQFTSVTLVSPSGLPQVSERGEPHHPAPLTHSPARPPADPLADPPVHPSTHPPADPTALHACYAAPPIRLTVDPKPPNPVPTGSQRFA